MGCFMDDVSAMMILAPLFHETLNRYNIDLVHFGVVAVVNMMIGLVTPPFGMLLFVLNALTGTSLRGMIRESVPFIIALLIVLLLLTLFPQLVLWLPQSMGYATM